MFIPKLIPYFKTSEPKLHISRKTLLVVGLLSQHVNLSVHPQCAIEKPLRINAQSKLPLPTQATHQLPDPHLQTHVFLAIFFANLNRMFVHKYPFSTHQDQDSIIATTSPDILTRNSNLYCEPPLISTKSSRQIRKTTLDYPGTPKVYILFKT